MCKVHVRIGVQSHTLCLSRSLSRLLPIADDHSIPHRGLVHVGIPGRHLKWFCDQRPPE
jgi:hypothetical protein